VNFDLYKNNRWADTNIYAAFILQNKYDRPLFINLFREDQLELLFKDVNNSFQINNLYKSRISDTSYSSSLYNLIWKPIDSLLIGVKKVYISPSGLLHRISFAAIPTPHGDRLIDRYSIEPVSSFRVIAKEREEQKTLNKTFALFGDIEYELEPSLSSRSLPNFNNTDSSVSRAVNGVIYLEQQMK
jgi:CHAT domain-containing protein